MFNFGVWLYEFGLFEGDFKKWDDYDLVVDFEVVIGLLVFSENDGMVVVVVELFYGVGW